MLEIIICVAYGGVTAIALLILNASIKRECKKAREKAENKNSGSKEPICDERAAVI